MSEARASIRHVPPWSCSQRMLRGDARRGAANGKVFCYVLACPNCGRPSLYLAEDMGLAEGPLVQAQGAFGDGTKAFEHPEALTSGSDCPCPGCGGRLRAAGRELVTLLPSTSRG